VRCWCPSTLIRRQPRFTVCSAVTWSSASTLDTVNREFQEEIGQSLTGVRLLGVLENIFRWEGATQHEIVFMFAAAFADQSAYEIQEQRILDKADGRTRVIWRAPGADSPPLYPTGTAGLLAADLALRRPG
jgi:ADP-ribose pyrophosphatase YjhB (NUDIX family)